MPVTKTAKRALRSSIKKAEVNKKILKRLEIAIRLAKKTLKDVDIKKAISIADRASKSKSSIKTRLQELKNLCLN